MTAPLVRSAAAEVFGRRFTPDWLPWAATAAIAFVLSGITFAVWKTQPWRTHALPAASASTPLHEENASALPVALAGAVRAEPRPPQLPQLLTEHLHDTDTDTAFVKLFGLWGAKYQPSTTDPCTQAASVGLACIAERGSFGQLRLYNHPAILLLHDGAGTTYQVVLTALDDEQAHLDLAGTRAVSLGELSRYWLGDFVMLWRPASSPVKALSSGMHGAQVRWLRQSLQRLRGAQSDGPVSDVFDDELATQVREFQRLHQLTVDGIAGVQTQIALAGAVAGSDAPLLSAVDTHHGG